MENKKHKKIQISESRLKKIVSEIISQEMASKDEKLLRKTIRENVRKQLRMLKEVDAKTTGVIDYTLRDMTGQDDYPYDDRYSDPSVGSYKIHKDAERIFRLPSKVKDGLMTLYSILDSVWRAQFVSYIKSYYENKTAYLSKINYAKGYLGEAWGKMHNSKTVFASTSNNKSSEMLSEEDDIAPIVYAVWGKIDAGRVWTSLNAVRVRKQDVIYGREIEDIYTFLSEHDDIIQEIYDIVIVQRTRP